VLPKRRIEFESESGWKKTRPGSQQNLLRLSIRSEAAGRFAISWIASRAPPVLGVTILWNLLRNDAFGLVAVEQAGEAVLSAAVASKAS
jgi:hypothetical protein